MAEIAEYHSLWSDNYADFLINEFFKLEEQLASFPFSGRVAPETNNPSIREIIIHNYRVIYTVSKSDTVQVLTIRSASRPFG
jgi:plasmid stabilization system protein ParE